MDNKEQLEAIQDIRKMMQRNERFLSLSGWSGISAGICALVGGFFAYRYMFNANIYDVIAHNVYIHNRNAIVPLLSIDSILQVAMSRLFRIALLTLLAALFCAFFFTFRRTQKTNTPLWGITTRKLFLHFSLPLAIGGIFILKIILLGYYDLIVASCLLFYGAALFSACHYSGSELKYLAIGEFVLGLIALCTLRHQLWLWMIGFGVFHILYGIVMWYRYERTA